MTTYTIEINECQRAVIEQALLDLPASAKNDELLLLIGMFACLPSEEAEVPGCLHSFTL
jgi:hypothetical protein